jgi:hypothetical protein
MGQNVNTETLSMSAPKIIMQNFNQAIMLELLKYQIISLFVQQIAVQFNS